MTTQVNWQRIRGELVRLTDMENLKDEVHRIGSEIRNFDFHSVLSPTAKERVKNFEKRYSDLMRTIHQAQRQMDREINRIMRQIKTHRADVTKAVSQQKEKLEKVSADFKKRFAMSAKRSAAAPKKKTATRKKSATSTAKSKTTTARKRRKA